MKCEYWNVYDCNGANPVFVKRIHYLGYLQTFMKESTSVGYLYTQGAYNV